MTPYDRKRKRILKSVLVALTLFILTFTLLFLLNLVFGDFLTEWGNGNPAVWVLFATLLVAAAYTPVDRAYTWLFRQVFFPRRPRMHFLLSRLAQELAATTDLTELANLLVNTLGEVLQLKTVSLLVLAPEGKGYVIASAYGWSVTDYRRLRIQTANPLLELMRGAGSQVLLREKAIRSLSWQEANTLTTQLDLLRASVVIPLWVKTELIGSINLFYPPQESRFDDGDLRLLGDFGQEVARSIRTALAIEQMRLLNEELRDAQSQMLQTAKISAIEQLATGIAHEIHNPLTIISGKAQVLLLQKDRKVYDEKVEEVLRTIVKQTRRAADITKKLLMFSRGSSSQREKLRLENVFEDTLALIAYQTSLEGIEIRRLMGQDLPDLWGNVQELREIFLNLLLNALQAIGSPPALTGRRPGGEGQIQVGMTFEKADQVFVIQIADNGPGIPPENLDKVFNPFFTTRPEGVGLGLFVTQQIVYRYGGSIRVESQPGEGTLVVVELPLEASAHPLSATATDSEMGGKEVHDSAVSSG